MGNANWDTGAAPNSRGSRAIIGANSPSNSGDFTLNQTMTLGEFSYHNTSSNRRAIEGTGSLVMHNTGSLESEIWISTSQGLDLNFGQIILQSNCEFRIQGPSRFVAKITGNSGFDLTGGGSLTLTNSNNNYLGSTTISNGTLNLRSDSTLPSTTNVLIKQNGFLDIFSTSQSVASITVQGTGGLRGDFGSTLSVSGHLDLGSSSVENNLGLIVGSIRMDGGTLFGWGDITVGSSNQDSLIRLGSFNQMLGRFNKVGTGTLVQENCLIDAGNSFVVHAGVYEFKGTASWRGSLQNNATIRYNISSPTYEVNRISGTGTVDITGTAVCNFIDDSTFTGPLKISNGVASIGNGGTGGSVGTGNIINNATLRFNRSNALLLSNQISGTGVVQQIGTGTTTLTGNNTYAGTTTIGSGALQIGNGSTTGTLGIGAVVNNSSLIFNRTNNFVVANAISGSGSVTKLGAGILQFTGTNTYTGTTTISAGTLRVGTGGTTGTLGTGAVVNNASLELYRNNALTLGNAISGTGSLSKIGAGTTTLTGSNTYSGTTTISGGALQIGNGSTTGSLGIGAVVNNASLILNRSNVYTIFNSISGSGSLTKLGAGTVRLDGANTYSGITDVHAGKLIVNNQHLNGNQYRVYSKAVLGGTGSIQSDVWVDSKAILDPGDNGFGTLSVFGNLTLSGIYNWELKDSASADLVAVFGNINLDGFLSLNLFPSKALEMRDKFTLFAYEGDITGGFINGFEGWEVNYTDKTPGINTYAGNGKFKYVTLTANASGPALYRMSDPYRLSNLTAVPEPSSAILIAVCTLCYSYRRRRACK